MSVGFRALALALAAVGFTAVSAAAGGDWRREWPLASDFSEALGQCPLHALDKDRVSFAEVDGVRAVRLENTRLTSNDHPEIALLPGFRFSCRVRLEKLPDVSYVPVNILQKGIVHSDVGKFILRVNSADEGGRIAFFANTDGSTEPRVSSSVVAKPGVWYDLSGGWDGREMVLTVNGQTFRQARSGRGGVTTGPLVVGPMNGSLADVKVSGPKASFGTDSPLAPGLNVACSVVFDSEPSGETTILRRNDEYQIRYDRMDPKRAGAFRFFVRLDGGWEPGCRIYKPVTPGVRYAISASWNGHRVTMQVDGEEHYHLHGGKPQPGPNPLSVSDRGMRVGDLAVRCIRRPMPTLEELKTSVLMPRAGEPVTVRAELTNPGETMRAGKICVTCPDGVEVTPAEVSFANLGETSRQPLSWQVNPGRRKDFTMDFRILDETGHPCGFDSRRFATMPEERPDLSAAAWSPKVSGRLAHYVDSERGDDAADGLTPATAWKSFRNVGGMTLGAGERLLLKRGSEFREELTVTARGRAKDWAEIGAYGEGPRPIIRRDRDIDDRCAHIVDPECLVVRDLVVCNAGKGLDIAVASSECRGGVLVERCLAHHIEGLYYNAHGIPEWKDRFGAPGPGSLGGINLSGRYLRNAVMRDCEQYACSFGFRVCGHNSFVCRNYCHDNVCHNTSPHPFLTDTTRAWLVDSVFERSGWNASAGTMSIMLGGNIALEISNCHFLSQPHSECPDEGGIDFEAGGANYLVDRCTFRNCAGAAIEVLGLRNPQARNVHIRGCRFDRNNFAKQLGPSEIFIWGGSKDPDIVCSSGLIEGNGYVLNDGVCFYTNRAERTRPNWKLTGNRAFRSSADLNRAMPYNEPPLAKVTGPEVWTGERSAKLAGAVTDDRLPTKAVSVRWEQLEGPAVAEIESAEKPTTDVRFSRVGDYRFNLTADDGELWRTARTAVHVLPAGSRVLKAWTFATDHDKEGWTTEALGTKHEIVECGLSFNSHPVDIVGGDYYVFAIKGATEPAFVSPDKLNLGLGRPLAVLLRFQNHTPAETMRLCWTESSNSSWSDKRSVDFAVVPNDTGDTTYRVPLPISSGLRQLKLLVSPNRAAVTGTCRVDYVAVGTFP